MKKGSDTIIGNKKSSIWFGNSIKGGTGMNKLGGGIVV